MQFSLDCYPCALRHTLQAVRKAGLTETQQHQVMQRVITGLLNQPPGATSPEIISQTHAIIRDLSGNEDAYAEEKAQSTHEALDLYPSLKKDVERSTDPFEYALRLAIAGNIIDFGALESYNLKETIQRVLKQPFAINDMEKLRKAVERADQILYLADNAGETVFDRLLIETMGKRVIYAVKEAPILNDATRQDALAAGLDKVAEVISCGSRVAGTLLSLCSKEFVGRFRSAEVIIAKGMGNYEALSTENAPIFFLLQIKCELVARDMGVPLGSIVVK